MMLRKVKNTADTRKADSPLAQARFARAYGMPATSRLHWQDAVRLVSDSVVRQSGTATSGTLTPGTLTDEERARYRLALALSGEASEEAVRLVMSGSGGSAHRLSHPLQRIQRDVGVLVNHPTLGIDPILEQSGRGLLGLGYTVSSF